jgi:hypothetical protein
LAVPCLWVGGRRRRRARGGRISADPTTRLRARRQRLRARCRRIEAWIMIYLMATSHLLHHRGGGGRARPWSSAWRDAPPPMEETAAGGDQTGGGVTWRDAADADELAGTCGWRAGCRAAEEVGGHWWSASSRVGEAKNLGPLSATLAVGGLLKKIYSTASCALAYPAPGTGCLRGAIAPGFGALGSSCTSGEHYQLKVEAANTTGWRGLQRRLQRTKADALLAQETWLTPDAVPAASAWARRRGWKTVW